jgi:NosR/NirI family nitrous oxide reductase transcriptional regulator
VSIFIERPYCKYICPLGASLAMPSTFRWFGLKRKQDCNSCKACAVGCGAQAIDADGRIDHRECLHCLDCMVLYTDTKGCPPLAKERKRREKMAWRSRPSARTATSSPSTRPRWKTRSAPRPKGPDPRMPTDRTLPAHKAGLLVAVLELRDHLWPWSREGWHSQRLADRRLLAGHGRHVAWVHGRPGPPVVGRHHRLVVRLERVRGADPPVRRRYVKDGPGGATSTASPA